MTDRSEMEAARKHGLRARHETRLARQDLAVIQEALDLMPATAGPPQGRRSAQEALVTDMVIPPEAVEAIREAIWHVLDAIQDRDYYGQVSPNEDADIITAAVVATLPHLRPLFETATKGDS